MLKISSTTLFLVLIGSLIRVIFSEDKRSLQLTNLPIKIFILIVNLPFHFDVTVLDILNMTRINSDQDRLSHMG